MFYICQLSIFSSFAFYLEAFVDDLMAKIDEIDCNLNAREAQTALLRDAFEFKAAITR